MNIFKKINDWKKSFKKKRNKNKYFNSKNEVKSSIREKLSSSGKYKIIISRFKTKPGSWDFSQGKVFKLDKRELITVVQRNYSSLPVLFIENHPNGHDYLITGSDYQGQTVIELDTGKRKDVLSVGSDKGCGFCWIDSEFNKDRQLLVVNGCFWGGPCEYKFFDFSNPMSGWVELDLGDEYIGEDNRKILFNEDGTIVSFQTEYNEAYDNKEEDEEMDLPPIASTKTFKIEGNKLILQQEWVSDKEQERRKQGEIAQKLYNEKMDKFRSGDPLYLSLLEGLKDKCFTTLSNHEGIGITYSGWCSGFNKQESRVCKRIAYNQNRFTIDLEFGIETGPVKLVIFKDGEVYEDKFFMEHSKESIEEALNYSKNLLNTPTL